MINQLYDYIESTGTNVAQMISIKDEINTWKRKNPTKKHPMVLIDLENFRDVFAQRDEMGVIMGGRYQLYNILFTRFVTDLHKMGVKVVCFAPQCDTNDQLDFFIPDKENEYIKNVQLLDKVCSKTDKPIRATLNIRHYRTVPMTIDFNLEKICRPHGELISNFVRHTQELAQYINSHESDVLAVISNNLNLLIFETSAQFWFANDISLRNLTIKLLSRENLEKLLGLTTKQLQLLAVLISSKYLPKKAVHNFINENINGKNINKIDFLANYVNQRTLPNPYSGQFFAIDDIAQDLVSEDSAMDVANALENGLDCYNMNLQTNTGGNAFVKFCKEHNSFIYRLITEEIYLVKDIAFIDFRSFKGKNYAELVVPLLQRILGILYKNDSEKPANRKICLKFAHDEPFKVARIDLIYPQIPMPTLFEFTFMTSEESFNATRWSMLTWLFELERDFVENLKTTSFSFTAVILTLQYLRQQGVITCTEADAILYTEYQIRNEELNLYQHKIHYPENANIDYLRLSHLYTKMYVFVSRCMEVCGLFRFTELLRFDGAQFHVAMTSFENPASTDYQIATYALKDLRFYQTN